MNYFISHATPIEQVLLKVTSSSHLHAKWLNTLSFLENCGARKIAACEHPILVKQEMLKHAAEEFRHAHHLKRQIEKVTPECLENYHLSSMLGRTNTLHYLDTLDTQTSRYLKGCGLTHDDIKQAAYLLVTYAIELRANELYPLYDRILRKSKSKVNVMSILLEEQGHLAEMTLGLEELPSGFVHARHVCCIEGDLCKKWLKTCNDEIDQSM